MNTPLTTMDEEKGTPQRVSLSCCSCFCPHGVNPEHMGENAARVMETLLECCLATGMTSRKGMEATDAAVRLLYIHRQMLARSERKQ